MSESVATTFGEESRVVRESQCSVTIELKRDQADDTTDLQAIKYASYCATLTAEDIQRDYRQFWNTRRENDLSPEQVGEMFTSFLWDSIDTEIRVTSEG